jgi:hypothetical protein
MIRAAAVFVAALLTGCSAADQLDCSGIGTVHGQYADANLGRAELRYGAVWGSAEAGHSVVLSGHQGTPRRCSAAHGRWSTAHSLPNCWALS